MAEEKQPNEESAPESGEVTEAQTTETTVETEGAAPGSDHHASSARSAINNNSPVVMTVAIVVLIAAVGFMWYSMQEPTYEPQPVYFYDLGTGELFEALSDEVPPIDAASGAEQGVRAHVFSCGSCADPSQRFIAYLETYTPEARTAMSGEVADEMMMDPAVMEEGHLVRAADGDEWVSAMSEEGMEVMEVVSNRCGPMKTAQPCMPSGG